MDSWANSSFYCFIVLSYYIMAAGLRRRVYKTAADLSFHVFMIYIVAISVLLILRYPSFDPFFLPFIVRASANSAAAARGGWWPHTCRGRFFYFIYVFMYSMHANFHKD